MSGVKRKSGSGIYKRTDKMKENMRNARKGQVVWNKGKKLPPHSEETKRKISRSCPKGEDHHNWKGGIFKKNPYKRKLFLNARRRIKKLKAVGSHTQGEWELLKRQYGYTCLACGKSEPHIILTEDHIIPLSKGGSDFIENIQPLCKGCNSKKHTDIINYR